MRGLQPFNARMHRVLIWSDADQTQDEMFPGSGGSAPAPPLGPLPPIGAGKGSGCWSGSFTATRCCDVARGPTGDWSYKPEQTQAADFQCFRPYGIPDGSFHHITAGGIEHHDTHIVRDRYTSIFGGVFGPPLFFCAAGSGCCGPDHIEHVAQL